MRSCSAMRSSMVESSRGRRFLGYYRNCMGARRQRGNESLHNPNEYKFFRTPVPNSSRGWDTGCLLQIHCCECAAIKDGTPVRDHLREQGSARTVSPLAVQVLI